MKKTTMLAAAGAAMILSQAADAQEAGQYVRPYWWDKPVVEGMGRAIVEVAPNRARFDLAFVETDGKSDEAMKKAVQRSKIAYDAIKKVAGDKARVTLDPTERHGFDYHSWFGFTLFAEGVRGSLGRGGTYAIRGADEPATGFSPVVVTPDELGDAWRDGKVTLIVRKDRTQEIKKVLKVIQENPKFQDLL